MSIEVIKGEATFEPAGKPLTVSDLEIILEKMKARNAELAAAQVQEVFRSDYTTVFRRADGHEMSVAYDGDGTWDWSGSVDQYGNAETRADAETAARKSLMEGV